MRYNGLEANISRECNNLTSDPEGQSQRILAFDWSTDLVLNHCND